jgi:hypothetical protein
VLLFCGFAVVIASGFFAYNSYLAQHSDLQKLAAMGNAFGGLNAFFAGIGIAGVIIAIIIQSVELRNQQQELRDNTSTILLTSYLGALDSLRQYYADEQKHERRSVHDSPSPYLAASLKYRLTTEKLEALVRHIERNESDLEHLEGAVIARSEHWAETLKRTIQIFTSEWSREMGKRTQVCTLYRQDKTVSTRTGNVQASALKGAVTDCNNQIVALIEEVENTSIRESGSTVLSSLASLVSEIERIGNANNERNKNEEWKPIPLDDTSQQELNDLFAPISKALDEVAGIVVNQLEANGRLDFVKA